MNERGTFLFCSTVGAPENSPQRQLWETNRNVISPGRGERTLILSQLFPVALAELEVFVLQTHGCRRGLLSFAAPRLKIK
jgi:hypothetical protein